MEIHLSRSTRKLCRPCGLHCANAFCSELAPAVLNHDLIDDGGVQHTVVHLTAAIDRGSASFPAHGKRSEKSRDGVTTLREEVVKIGAKVITHARYTVFQMAEVEVPSSLLRRILAMIDDLRPRRIAPCCTGSQKQLQPPTKLTEGVCPKWCLMGGAGAGWRTRAGSRAYRAAQAISQSLDRNRIRVSLGVARSGFEGRSGA